MNGVWLVDKPRGVTSHDVVARVRRLLKTRQVGHAGTLDPMATGLLVILVGEATKLSPFLTSERKTYLTTVTLGVATDSLDADGRVTDQQPVSDEIRREIALGESSLVLKQILDDERKRCAQVPPAVSAIHVDGERAHERVRRGEEVTLEPRPVEVSSLALQAIDAGAPLPTMTFELSVSKGYYVRSFGRDVGAALGLPAHLSALRRLRSGAFDVADATPLAPDPALLSLEDAARRALRWVDLTTQGAERARVGKALSVDDFEVPPAEGLAAWGAGGALLAVGEGREGVFRVTRGFVQAR